MIVNKAFILVFCPKEQLKSISIADELCFRSYNQGLL